MLFHLDNLQKSRESIAEVMQALQPASADELLNKARQQESVAPNNSSIDTSCNPEVQVRIRSRRQVRRPL